MVTSFKRLPWYAWIFVPLFLPVLLVVVVPLGIIALLSIVYFSVFPERHLHIWDCEGTAHQRRRLSQWRSRYRQCSLGGRIVRAFTGKRRLQMVRQMSMTFRNC